MTRYTSALIVTFALAAAVSAQEMRPATQPVRFAAVDVFVDSGATPLAAWQIEFFAAKGSVEIVGIEGGAHPAFHDPPYYDPRVLKRDRAVLAAFTTGKDLPTGRTRVARVHVMITGDVEPAYKANLRVAASPDGTEIHATVTLAEGEGK